MWKYTAIALSLGLVTVALQVDSVFDPRFSEDVVAATHTFLETELEE